MAAFSGYDGAPMTRLRRNGSPVDERDAPGVRMNEKHTSAVSQLPECTAFIASMSANATTGVGRVWWVIVGIPSIDAS
jgi:hypothetical protein